MCREIVEGAIAFRERADHHRIPRYQHLVIARRLHPLFARLEKPFANLTNLRRHLVFRDFEHPRRVGQLDRAMQNVGVLKIALDRDVKVALGNRAKLGTDDRLNLFGRPDEKLPLLALAVGVLRGVEAAFGTGHFA